MTALAADESFMAHLGRVRQAFEKEILLGIGGLRALYEMGLEPQVCHMNEGHSAFIRLERLARLMGNHGLDKKTAMEIIVRRAKHGT